MSPAYEQREKEAMAQRKGFHLILEVPFIYNFVQQVFQHEPTKSVWNRLIAERMSGFVLDVGCGPGNQSRAFASSKKYVGIDISETYISEAKILGVVSKR